MADRLQAMRRVAAVRVAQRAVAQTKLHAATRSAGEAATALALAERQVEAAFVLWRVQAESMLFEPEIERHFAGQLVLRTGDHQTAGETRDEAVAAVTKAQHGLHRAEAAVDQSEALLGRLRRADRLRREERRMAEQADVVTRNWRRA